MLGQRLVEARRELGPVDRDAGLGRRLERRAEALGEVAAPPRRDRCRPSRPCLSLLVGRPRRRPAAGLGRLAGARRARVRTSLPSREKRQTTPIATEHRSSG